MADIYNFFEINSILGENEISPEEADKIEEFLEQKYPDIKLREEDSQKIFANIMREIVKSKNSK